MIVLVLCLAGLNACKKELVSEVIPGKAGSVGVNDRDGGAATNTLSMQAFKETSTKEYEALGKIMFEYLTRGQHIEASEYFLPASIRESIKQEVEADISVKSFEEVVAEIQTSTNAQQLAFITNFALQVKAKLDENEINSFGKFWYYLIDKESEIAASPNFTSNEKEVLLNLSATLRYTAKYDYSQGKEPPQEGIGPEGECDLLFKIKKDCVIAALLKAFVGAVAVGPLGPGVGGTKFLLKFAWEIYKAKKIHYVSVVD